MAEHLTHGWEPAIDTADTLVRSFVYALGDRLAYVTTALGGRVRRADAYIAADPHSQIAWDNAAVLLQPPFVAETLGVVDEMVEFFGPDRGWILFSPWVLPDLTERGFMLVGHPPMMFRAAGAGPFEVPSGLEIVEVRDKRTFRDWADAVIEGFPMQGDTTIVDEHVLGGPVRFFVGYADGKPVATSGVFVGHGVNEVEWVSTLPAYRGRGFGAALTWAATLADPSLPAVLLASDDGRPVYARMGYAALSRFTAWSHTAG